MSAAVRQPLRNAIHLATGLAAVWVLLVDSPWRWLGIAGMVAVALAVDVGRWLGGRSWLDRWLPGVYRDPEPLGVSAATLLAVGYLAAVLLFSPLAAAGGIAALAVGDPAAAVVGHWYGRRTGQRGKTWVGSVACFLAALAAIGSLPGFGLAAAAAGGAMAALVERRAGRLDNLLVPVGVGMLLELWIS